MVWVVIIEDRHTDVEVELYHEKEEAIGYARTFAEGACYHPEDYEEHDYVKDWVFHVTYSCEGDSVRVLEKEIH